MPHCTPEQLALAALREPLPDADAAHLESCEECRAEVASLQRAVDALAVPQLAAPGAPVAPPAGVWAAIAASTGVTATPRSAAEAPAEPPTESPAEAAVLPFRSRRRPLLMAAAAAVAGAAIGAGTVAVLQSGNDAAKPVTAVDLAPLAEADASGRAEVVVRDDGSRALQVELDAPARDDSYYEVWTIARDMSGMFSLGVVRPGTQTVELPEGLDLGEFPLVDVSVEPLDGDPAHSGVSVARGELES